MIRIACFSFLRWSWLLGLPSVVAWPAPLWPARRLFFGARVTVVVYCYYCYLINWSFKVDPVLHTYLSLDCPLPRRSLPTTLHYTTLHYTTLNHGRFTPRAAAPPHTTTPALRRRPSRPVRMWWWSKTHIGHHLPQPPPHNHLLHTHPSTHLLDLAVGAPGAGRLAGDAPVVLRHGEARLRAQLLLHLRLVF